MLDKANIQYGSLSRQEITLKDLTFGNASDKEISATHQNLQQDDEANHITIHNLKLARVYRPTIRIFSDISNTSKSIHECVQDDFVCDFWKCNNNETIPASAVCNGTSPSGKSDCSDGSDESDALCKGKSIKRNYILIGLCCHIFFGVVYYGK